MALVAQPGTVSCESLEEILTGFVWRCSVDQYHAMIRADILTEDDPVELLEGWLIVKMSKNPPHRVTTGLIREAIARLVPATCYVDTQEPITLTDSEPEPDVAVVWGARRDYSDRHPGPQDVAFVVEVADSSLQRDRVVKQRIYARAGIPIYWVINLVENRCEVYTEPSGATERPVYHQRQDYGPSDMVPVVLEGVEVGRIAVRELLP